MVTVCYIGIVCIIVALGGFAAVYFARKSERQRRADGWASVLSDRGMPGIVTNTGPKSERAYKQSANFGRVYRTSEPVIVDPLPSLYDYSHAPAIVDHAPSYSTDHSSSYSDCSSYDSGDCSSSCDAGSSGGCD